MIEPPPQRTSIAADVRSVGAQPPAASNLEWELPILTCCYNNTPA